MYLDPISSFIDSNEDAVMKYRESLVTKKRDPKKLPSPERLALQRELLLAANESSEELAGLLKAKLGISSSDLSIFPTLNNRLADEELGKRLPETAEHIHSALAAGGCTRRQASAGSYWLYCIIRWMEEGQIPSPPIKELIPNSVTLDWLQSSFTLTPTAGPAQGKHIDDRVRDLLRNAGGVPHIRDRTSYMHDCAAANQWWAVELSNAIIGEIGTTFTYSEVLGYLLKQQIMDEVVRWVSRLTGRLSQTRALAAALEAAIGRQQTSQSDYKPPTRLQLRELMEKLARRTRRWRIDSNSPYSVQDLSSLCFD